MGEWRRAAIMVAVVMIIPNMRYAQGVADEMDSLHGVLEHLYDEMMPLCGQLIGVGQGIASFAVLFYIASRVWRHQGAVHRTIWAISSKVIHNQKGGIMFTKMKNIDTAFRHVRGFIMLICCFALYKSFSLVSQMQGKIYILANGKALEAYASDRRDNIPVEARDHVRTFHTFFFTLDTDDKAIQANVTKALYLADDGAKSVYDDLKTTNKNQFN